MDDVITGASVYTPFVEPPDYLSFVDEDIRRMFVGKGPYLCSDVLMAQHIKELRLLREALAQRGPDPISVKIDHD